MTRSADPDRQATVSLSRRRWLQRSALGAATALGAGSLANLLVGTRPAYAADYRALVCVFLYGGNDGMNMVVPADATRHAQYSAVRGALALPRNSLLPLGTDYGLHPAMSALQPLWGAGQLAPVFNVGPLYRPLSKAEYRAARGAPDIPDQLYSHSDQQLLWECGGSEALARTGWGGRASDALGTVNPVISLGGTGRFGLSATQAPLVLPGPGGTFGAYGLDAAGTTWAPHLARKTALDALYRADQVASLDNRLADAYAVLHRDAFDKSDRLAGLIKAQPGQDAAYAAIDSAFAGLVNGSTFASPLAEQLYQVAKLVAGNATVQGNRQIFFVQADGFDTHAGQVTADSPLAGTHAVLLGRVAGALAAFQNALNGVGLGQQVTTFTQSDFGRTFTPNSTLGTDHAWGNHQLVMGGAVHGGRSYGTYPDLTLGGADDVGVQAWEQQGRWIPTTSVDQYAATLLAWFGAGTGQLDSVLPNLARFGVRNLGFV